MKSKLLPILLLAGVLGCSQSPVRKPLFQSAGDTLVVQDQRLVFTTEQPSWQATLYTVVQPVTLATDYTQGRLQVYLPEEKGGVVEGPAQVELLFEGQAYYYPVWVRNRYTGQEKRREYRSPKTVNPDSVLVQQKIVHTIDHFRNLVRLPENGYFEEEALQTGPRAGTFLADTSQPLSAYYVEPGTSVSVPLRVTFNQSTNEFDVRVGPLRDRYGNTVADGTLVVLTARNGDRVWRMEETLLGGIANRSLSASDFGGYRIQAHVDEKISETLKLTR